MKSKGISNQISYGDDNIAQPTELYYDGFSATFTLSIAYSGIHKSCLHQPKHETTKLNSGAGTFQNLQIQTKSIVKYSCRSLVLIQTKQLANMEAAGNNYAVLYRMWNDFSEPPSE
jgi:hypothetical protein